MTAEICLMNRLAVVLAADSATTVTHWEDGKSEQRYFKGANKIFQLSNFKPIGMMIFDSAELLSVPWEVVVKEFRAELGDKSYDHVSDYAKAFFDFLNSNQLVFPPDVRRRNFLSGANSAGIRNGSVISAAIPAGDPHPDQTTNAALAARRAELDTHPFPDGTTQENLDATIAANRDHLANEIDTFLKVPPVTPFAGDLLQLAEIALVEVSKFPGHYLGTTGIVFAGFGDKDLFPVVVEYQSCSYVGDAHIALKKTETKIDHNSPARLIPFAQKAMAETFRMGISQDVYMSLMEAVHDEAAQLANDVIAAAGGNAAQIPNLNDILDQAKERVSNRVLSRARKENLYPLQRVIGSLPIEEMANVAETLVNLQSLKERFTKPSETVGGPVDVAVITRSEGLVWVKRKLYFPGELNSRFQQRQASLYK